MKNTDKSKLLKKLDNFQSLVSELDKTCGGNNQLENLPQLKLLKNGE